MTSSFVAAYLGIPSPLPYKLRRAGGGRERYGMNFAYGGTGVFHTLVMLPNLTTQIDFFEQLVHQGTYRSSQLRSSMALVSTSFNDYGFYASTKGTLRGLNEFIELVVNRIAVDLRRLGRLGLRKTAIVNLVPLGCPPVGRQLLGSPANSCNELLNRYASHHNRLLQRAVDDINADLRHPMHVVVLDLYNAAISIIHHHGASGSRFRDPLEPCCVGLNSNSSCASVDAEGKPLYSVCPSPSLFFFWDTAHPTQAGWSAIVRYFLPTLHQFFPS